MNPFDVTYELSRRGFIILGAIAPSVRPDNIIVIIIIIIIIFIIYKAQYPNILKALYNKIKSYLLRVKTNINNNKYNCKINFQIKQM